MEDPLEKYTIRTRVEPGLECLVHIIILGRGLGPEEKGDPGSYSIDPFVPNPKGDLTNEVIMRKMLCVFVGVIENKVENVTGFDYHDTEAPRDMDVSVSAGEHGISSVYINGKQGETRLDKMYTPSSPAWGRWKATIFKFFGF